MTNMPQNEHQNRIAQARRLMSEQGVDGLIVTDPVHYTYFTGHKVPAWMKARPSIFILPLKGEPALITWSGPGMFARLYEQPFPSWVEDRRIYPDVPFTDEVRVDWGIADVLRDRGLASARLALEIGRDTWLGIPVIDYQRLTEQLNQAQFVDSGPIVWGCRMIKSEWEIDCMRQACSIGADAWRRVMQEARPGCSIRAIQQKIVQYYGENGADLDSGPPAVLGATGAGGTFQRGDILYIDGGCNYRGYQMDITRRAVFGQPSARQRDEHEGMWALMHEIIGMMKSGTAVRELFEFSQTRLAARPDWRNYADHPAKRIGHGIGLETEPPSISGTDMTVLQAGMVLTPEPKIESVDGLVNPEEQVVVRDSGGELLSDSSGSKLYVIG